MKFCQPIKPLELFTDEELTDAFCCGGQHQFAIEIFERWNKARAELAKAREACEQGKARCQNFLNGLLPACGPMTMGTAAMIASIQNDFKEALGHDFESEAAALAPATEKGAG